MHGGESPRTLTEQVVSPSRGRRILEGVKEPSLNLLMQEEYNLARGLTPGRSLSE